MAYDFDLFVIGGGSGGVRAGRLAAASGARVGLAEEYRMGGTCVIRGCVPKKLMVFAAQAGAAASEARDYGWDSAPGAFDWARFRTALHAELDRLEAAYTRNYAAAGGELFAERATVTGPHSVRLASGRDLTAERILVATGGRPFIPRFEGNDLVWTSNDVFLADRLPERVLIVGGGYIACEFAAILNGLGVGVAQVYRGAQILRGFDDEARGMIAEHMHHAGIDLHVGTNVEWVRRDGDRFAVKLTDGRRDSYDAVLYATGRVANTQGLGLAELGVGLSRYGAVQVDAWSRTAVPSIWAIGDVTDRVNLTPVAIRDAVAFHETEFNGNPTSPDHALIPTAVFTRPEFGTIGMTEEAARDERPIEIYATAFRPMQSAFVGRPERVLFKLIVCAESRLILGCHIVAPGAAELIQMVGVAIKMGATKEDFDRTVAVHPTMSEEIVLMREPVRTA